MNRALDSLSKPSVAFLQLDKGSDFVLLPGSLLDSCLKTQSLFLKRFNLLKTNHSISMHTQKIKHKLPLIPT